MRSFAGGFGLRRLYLRVACVGLTYLGFTVYSDVELADWSMAAGVWNLKRRRVFEFMHASTLIRGFRGVGEVT